MGNKEHRLYDHMSQFYNKLDEINNLDITKLEKELLIKEQIEKESLLRKKDIDFTSQIFEIRTLYVKNPLYYQYCINSYIEDKYIKCECTFLEMRNAFLLYHSFLKNLGFIDQNKKREINELVFIDLVKDRFNIFKATLKEMIDRYPYIEIITPGDITTYIPDFDMCDYYEEYYLYRNNYLNLRQCEYEKMAKIGGKTICIESFIEMCNCLLYPIEVNEKSFGKDVGWLKIDLQSLFYTSKCMRLKQTNYKRIKNAYRNIYYHHSYNFKYYIAKDNKRFPKYAFEIYVECLMCNYKQDLDFEEICSLCSMSNEDEYDLLWKNSYYRFCRYLDDNVVKKYTIEKKETQFSDITPEDCITICIRRFERCYYMRRDDYGIIHKSKFDCDHKINAFLEDKYCLLEIDYNSKEALEDFDNYIYERYKEKYEYDFMQYHEIREKVLKKIYEDLINKKIDYTHITFLDFIDKYLSYI